MVQVLPGVGGFGSQLGAALGAGVQRGAGRATDFAAQMGMEKAKLSNKRKLYESVKGKSQLSLSPEMKKKTFLEMLPRIEEMKGSELTPQDLDSIWSNFDQVAQSTGMLQGREQQEDPFAEAESFELIGEPGLARISTEKAKLGQKMAAEEKKQSYELAKPTLDRSRELAQDLPYKEAAVLGMEESIKSGNLGAFSLDNLAEITGIEAFRSPEGAAFKTQSKEYFLGNLSRVGSKGLNQMMEKVILQMSPLIGRSNEANLAVSEILHAENDVTRKEVELTNRIATEYKEKYGHFPDNLSERVMDELRPFAIQRQKDTLKKIDEIKDRYEPVNKKGHLMRDPSGNLRRVSAKDYKKAKAAGYVVSK